MSARFFLFQVAHLGILVGVVLPAASRSALASSIAPVPCTIRARAVIATTGQVFLNAPSLVDSYKSRQGPYGGANAGSLAVIQAGQSIVNNGGILHGSMMQNSPSSLAVPPVPQDANNLPLGSAGPGNLNINGSSDSITLAPGNYVAANINVNYPGSIVVSPPGPVAIWVTGTLNLGGNENLNGSPANLAFMVAGSGPVNVNSNGKMFGTIYAPASTINLNSAVFGSVVGAAVTLNSGSAVHSDQSAVCPPTPPVSQPSPLPPPPREAGCFHWTDNGWQTAVCMTDEEKKTLPVPETPEVAISSQPQTEGDPGLRTPLVFGQVETTFLSSVVETDSKYNGDTLTVQNNTNYFNYDPQTQQFHGWVQFVVHARDWLAPSKGTSICIWNIHWFPHDLTSATQCYGTEIGSPSLPLPKRQGPFRRFDFANIAGYSFAGANGVNLLGMVAELTWVPENTKRRYAVVTPDAYGLAGQWYNVSGGVYGLGDSSVAKFTNTQVMTRISASSCQGDTQTNSPTCSGQPDLLPLVTRLDPSNPIFGQNAVTGESSNLQLMGAPAPIVALNRQLVATEYLMSTNGTCLTGGYAYLKDREFDNGGIDSWYPGEDPFWESPDIFVVPHGAAAPGINEVPVDFAMAAGTPYDVYLRVNNDFGCDSIEGVKVRIFGAEPDLGFAFWQGVTTNAGSGAYVDNSNNPNGAGSTIGPYGKVMMGPFPWTPNAAGHRCLMAAVEANNQSPPSDPLPIAYKSNQVAQRNVQIGDISQCTYSISNTSGADAQLTLGIAVSPADPVPGSDGGPLIDLTFDDPSTSWYQAWNGQPGITVTASGGYTTVRLGTNHIALNSVRVPSLLAGQTAPTISIAHAGGPIASVDISSTLTSIPGPHEIPVQILSQNGGSCLFELPMVICPPGETMCGGLCVDTMTDQNNCGSCGHACASYQFCYEGYCLHTE